MSRQQELMARHAQALVGNYGKMPAVMVRGQGSELWDAEGKRYLDLFAGFGGTILGHAHPALVEAITHQARQLWAVGNQFYSEPQIRLAEHLSQKGFEGRAFFCHSGAEAAEAAIKLARLSAGEGRFKIISMHRGFHGRTLGALSATPVAAYQQGFGPMTPGFVHVPYNDLAALEAAIDPQTAGIILEPIQGEGGMHPALPQYAQGLRALCDQHRLALIFDEVWTGVGRTGRYFGHQHLGVTPDIMTMGKALGGGIPVGGILARPDRAAFFKPGTHGCTLGGNPICAAVAAAIFDTLASENLVAQTEARGLWLQDAIRSFSCASRLIKEIRGHGFFQGIELMMPDATALVGTALANGLILNVTQKNVVRLCPALNIPQAQLQEGLELFEKSLLAL